MNPSNLVRYSLLFMAFGTCITIAPLAHADSCGIGSAVNRFNRIDSPTITDFARPLQVIEDQAHLSKPFYHCDDDDDLTPGMDFLNQYLHVLTNDLDRGDRDPGVVEMRSLIAKMQKVYDNIQAGCGSHCP
jgi:hypothetical protein